MAIGTVGGNAVATPASVAMADPSLEPYVESATAQTAAAVVITAILTPILTGWVSRRASKKTRSQSGCIFLRRQRKLIWKGLIHQ